MIYVTGAYCDLKLATVSVSVGVSVSVSREVHRGRERYEEGSGQYLLMTRTKIRHANVFCIFCFVLGVNSNLALNLSN